MPSSSMLMRVCGSGHFAVTCMHDASGCAGEPHQLHASLEAVRLEATAAVAQTATDAVEAVKQTATGAGVNGGSGNRAAGTGGDPRKQGPQFPYPPQSQTAPGKESKMYPPPDYGYDSSRGSGKLMEKVALVTGADSGIGRAIALAFAREGMDIAIAHLNEHDDAEETRRIVTEAGRQALLLPGDLSTEAACKDIVQKTVDRFGHIDVLVNNAGWQGSVISDIREVDRECLEHTYRLNVFAPFALTQASVAHMKPGSSILNVPSDEAYGPQFMLLDYATTKVAIYTFTKGAASAVMSDFGIRINCVARGPCWTPLIPISFDTKTSSVMGKGITPIGRAAQPREIAPAFVLLASDGASYMTGSTLAVTGGMYTN